MSEPLAQRLLDAHRMVAGNDSRVPGETSAIAPDVLVVDPESASFLMSAFGRLGVTRAGLDALAVPAEALQVAIGAPSEQAVELVEWSRRHGLRCALPGSGTPFALATEGFAAPGRVIAGTGGAAAACGAFGALALDLSPIEAAVCLSGLPLLRTPDSILGITLTGVPSAGVGGVEIAAALLSLAGARRPGVVEFSGEGVRELPIADRVAATWLGTALTGAAVLFPSDAATAAWLESRGRGADWKGLERAAPDPSPAHAIALDALAPALIECAPQPLALDLAARAGHPVAAVVLGPRCTLEDLAEFVHALGGRAIAAGVQAAWVPAGRAQRDALDAVGLESVLRDAGVQIVEDGDPLPGEGAGAHLACGIAPSRLRDAPRRWWIAGPSALAASAIAGAVSAPEAPGVARALMHPPAPVLPRVDEVADEPVASVAHPQGPELHGTTQLTIAIVLGDQVAASEFLPWGARLERVRHDPHALAAHVLGRIDPEFAERARAARPTAVVAGHALGAGEVHPAAAPALRELGVRAVLAESFAPVFHRRLVEAGILPLRLPRAADRGAFSRGDCVELPALEESVAPGRGILARNLGRGVRVVLDHDLDPLAIAVVRHGGLLGLARVERGRWRRADAC